MSPNEKDAARLDQLPYYRDYVEQILRPRVSRLVDDVRSRLTEQVWAEIVERMAEDQKQGGGNDPQAIEKLRSLLVDTLGLKIAVHLDAQFAGVPAAAATPLNSGSSTASNGQEVVDRAFPNNPLARAVGGLRRAGS